MKLEFDGWYWKVRWIDFNVSFQDSEKRKMNIVIFFFSLIFILSIMGAVWLQISWESEARFLIWFVVYFVGLFEIFLLLRWQDCKTWMIAKKENSISYRNRFGKIKETQVVDIIKVEVNRYARIKVFCVNLLDSWKNIRIVFVGGRKFWPDVLMRWK